MVIGVQVIPPPRQRQPRQKPRRRAARIGTKVDRRAISIILLDDTGAERMRWNVRGAWPIKWSGPSFDAGSDAIAIESLELAHEGIEVAKW